MDIFSGHVIFKTLLKESDWLLRFLFAFYRIFSVNLLLSRKNTSISFYFSIFFFFFQNLTNFDIVSYTEHCQFHSSEDRSYCVGVLT